MRLTRYLLLAIAATLLFSSMTSAQTRKRPAKRTTTAAKPALPPLDVRAARVKVSNQLANITQFVSQLGPIAQAIEDFDAEAATRRVNKQSVDRNTANKQKVVIAIRGLREGMIKLESEFRVKPALKKYLTTIQGISNLAGEAEDSAVAGKFVAANTPLRTIQQKLNDTLSAMPTAEL
jgi:hypothetical protein